MAYTAAALAAAARPVTLSIGRASDRRGWRWVSRWWIRTARTWQAKPISVEQMLALQAARRDPMRYLLQLATTVRAVLPPRWWYRLLGDPARMILALPPDAMGFVLKALVTVPDTDRDVSQESDDPHAARRRADRASVNGTGADEGGVSLAVAALSVRATFGEAWYYDPQRWLTSDGYAPFARALIEHEGVQILEARGMLTVADGMGLSHAKPYDRDRVRRLAYPKELA